MGFFTTCAWHAHEGVLSEFVLQAQALRRLSHLVLVDAQTAIVVAAYVLRGMRSKTDSLLLGKPVLATVRWNQITQLLRWLAQGRLADAHQVLLLHQDRARLEGSLAPRGLLALQRRQLLPGQRDPDLADLLCATHSRVLQNL